ncbi:calcium-binding protein (plasmid) [Paracoccus liaowanqingii]|uniref:Calcium-binding protein n=1 Tax=Paracoccus liaowanqingii TaxID=2560053 RepID=A0A4Y5SQV7_9RHOB|nr:calcium-binding protein [Paracoccus liaowanqingii]QDA35892.1 calcium-binding protein [Paracoccus liaowanqingii]
MGGEIFIESGRARSFGLPVSEHLYLVFRDSNDEEYVLRAGPPSRFWPFGEMEIEVNVPIADSADARNGETPEERSSTPLDFPGITDDQAWAMMVKYARSIDDADYRYDVLEENSNAFVGALLHAAGGQADKMLPDGIRSSAAVGFSSWSNIVEDVAPPRDWIFWGTGGADVMTGLQIDEEFRTGSGNDVVNAARGDDIVRAGSGSDALNGQGGHDRLFGESGDDTLRGGDGSDWLNGGAGNDLLDGGSGVDRAVFSGPVAALVDLRITGTQSTGHGMDMLRGIEHIVSGSGNDRLIGNGAGNLLAAGAGNDQLYGLDGNDRLSGGRGSDVLHGGAGNDRLIGGEGVDQFVFADLADGEFDTVVDFEPGVDRLRFANISQFSELRLSGGADGGISFAEVEGETFRVRLEGIDMRDLTQDAFAFV